MAEVTCELPYLPGATGESDREGFPDKNFPKECVCIPSKPYSFHSVHSAIGSRMNGMIFRSFRKRNSCSQKNTNTVYSEYSYSGIVPKERALNIYFTSSVNIMRFIQLYYVYIVMLPPSTRIKLSYFVV